MLLLRAERIKKIYGDRVVLDIEEFSVYTGDRIGVVGANGAFCLPRPSFCTEHSPGNIAD